MNINISSESSLVKFSELKSGDVFRPTDCYCYFLKVQSNRSLNNAIDLETNLQVYFEEDTMVYKAKSANLSIIF